MTFEERADLFMGLHQEGTLVLPNAWDAASAAMIAATGAVAVATTSSGISWSLGVRDGENLGRAGAIDALRRVAHAVAIPVSADIEAGYGATPSDVAKTIRAVIDAGAVGVNIEDRCWENPTTLRPIDEQCERLAAARAAAADSTKSPFLINARCDAHLAAIGSADQRTELVLERAQRYRRAGADCLFVPGLTELNEIHRLVDGSALPLNVLLAPGRGPGIRELSGAGVRRISVGHAIAAAAYRTIRTATAALLAGDDAPFAGAVPYQEMQALLGPESGSHDRV